MRTEPAYERLPTDSQQNTPESTSDRSDDDGIPRHSHDDYAAIPLHADRVELQSLPQLQSASIPTPEPLSERQMEPGSICICQVGQARRTITVEFDWTIQQLKEHAYKEALSEDKCVRFIFRGKMLASTRTLEDCSVITGSFLHVMISDHVPAHEQVAQEQNASGDPDVQIAEDAALAQILGRVNRDGDDDDDEIREGTNAEILWGFTLGIIMGEIMFIWVFQRTVSRRQRIGIVLGIVVHMCISYFQSDDKHRWGQNPWNHTPPPRVTQVPMHAQSMLLDGFSRITWPGG